MFAESLQRGLAAGGWVIGFIAAVGIFLGICYIIVLALSSALGEVQEIERRNKANERKNQQP